MGSERSVPKRELIFKQLSLIKPNTKELAMVALLLVVIILILIL